jgi:hypothetical protein
MNSYIHSLTSDSRRWWWPSAAAGVAGSAVIAAILVLPAAVQAVPEPVAPAEPAGAVLVGEVRDRQCFLLQPRWNVALEGLQPLCGDPVTQPARGASRPGLTYGP